jgi:hypothetical protein
MWLLVFVVSLLVTVVPVMIGARIVGAKRTGFWICLLAILVAGLIAGIALGMFRGGGLLSVLADALAYMLILDTTYLRGLAIALIQWVLTAVLAVAAAMLIFGGMAAGMHRLLRDAPFRLDAPAQNV